MTNCLSSGSPVEVVWTKLSKTATAGTKTIELEHSVDWKAGDQIVIATTGERHSQGETEVTVLYTYLIVDILGYKLHNCNNCSL